jgi:hypothetical protein
MDVTRAAVADSFDEAGAGTPDVLFFVALVSAL